MTVGRDSRADILLDDSTVSRSHAVFRRVGDTFAVYDSGSLNGTYVNRQRVDHQQLRNGDEIMIGKFRLVSSPNPPLSRDDAKPCALDWDGTSFM